MRDNCDRKWLWIEEKIWHKKIFMEDKCLRLLLIDDNLRWKTSFYGRLDMKSGVLKLYSMLVVFHQKLSFIKSCLSPKFVFYQRLSSIEDHLSKNMSSSKYLIPSKDVFYWRSSCIQGYILLNIAFFSLWWFLMCSRLV